MLAHFKQNLRAYPFFYLLFALAIILSIPGLFYPSTGNDQQSFFTFVVRPFLYGYVFLAAVAPKTFWKKFLIIQFPFVATAVYLAVIFYLYHESPAVQESMTFFVMPILLTACCTAVTVFLLAEHFRGRVFGYLLLLLMLAGFSMLQVPSVKRLDRSVRLDVYNDTLERIAAKEYENAQEAIQSCEKIDTTDLNYGDGYANCIRALAVAEADAVLCDEIVNETEKLNCRGAVVKTEPIETRIAVCDEASTEALRNDCLLYLRAPNNLSAADARKVCDAISDNTIAPESYNGKGIKENCYLSLQYIQ